MDVTVEEAGPCRKTLTFKIPPEEIRRQVDDAYRNVARHASIKGFRPGKVPRRVLEKRFGNEILAEAKQEIVSSAFEKALRDHELRPIGEPQIEGLKDEPLDESAPLEFRVHVSLRPEVQVRETRGIEVKRAHTEVSPEEIESALAQVADQRKTLQEVDEPATENDFVVADLVFRDEADEVVAERKSVKLNTRIPIAGTDPETFAARLNGAVKDQKLSMELTFPETFEKEAVRGRPGVVEVHVRQVMRITPPPIDDELAKSFDYENLEAMREDLARRIGEEKERHEKARQEEEILDALIAENPFPIPEEIVEEQTRRNLAMFEQRLREAGLGDEEVSQKLTEARDEARREAERQVRVFFLLEAVAAKEKIFVTEGDVEAELRAIAAENRVSPEDVRRLYEERKAFGELRSRILERKVREFLREKARFTD